MFNFPHTGTFIFSLIAAPLLFIASYVYHSRVKNVVFSWKKPQIVFLTILTFIINLTLFILACFFFAGYFGSIEGIELIKIPTQYLKTIGIDCLLLIFGITLSYLAVQNFFVQQITDTGIVFTDKLFALRKSQTHTIAWEHIKDFYINSDYPVTVYTFIYQPTEGDIYLRKTLKVPFYALPRFKALLEENMVKYQALRDQKRAFLRNLSVN